MPRPSEAQVLTGSIVGSVKDQTEALVPDAKISITNEGTGQSRQTVSDAAGAYSLTNIEAGAYDLSVAKEGFETFVSKGIRVTVDQVARVDATLHPGQVTQTIEVVGQSPVLQTDSSQVRGEVNTTAIASIPLAGWDGNYESLLVTVPGMTMPINANSIAANPSRGLEYYTNGTTAQTNDVRIDGVSADNLWLPYLTGYVPSREAIQSVSVLTSSIDVSQGIVGGAAVNVHIKSGSNSTHGSLYWYNMNNNMEAEPFNFVPPPAGYRVPKLINNDFGGTVGGHIIKNKLFYFGSLEANDIDEYAQQTETVPLATMRQGDFLGADNPGATNTVIYNPFTGTASGTGRTAFTGNVIPSNLISPISALILKDMVPLPNESGATNNFFASGDFKFNRYTMDTKEDWNVTDKLRLNGRLGYIKASTTEPAAFGPASGVAENGPALFSSRIGNGGGTVYNATVSATYLMRSNLVINGYFGMSLFNTFNNAPNENVNEGTSTLGIPGTNGATENYGGWPYFTTSNYASWGSYTSTGGPIVYHDHSWQYVAGASWVKGSHSIGFGGSITRGSWKHFESASGAAGEFTFTVGETALNTGTGSSSTGQFNDMAAFLLGVPSSIGHDTFPENGGYMVQHVWQYALYVQDQWQFRKNLTLTGGLSWNYFPMGARDGRGFERYIFSTNQIEICGEGGNPYNCGYDVSKLEFSPSAGIAYRPTSTLVVRVGGSLIYDPEPLAFVRDLISNYPEDDSLTAAANNSYSYVSTLASGLPAIVAPNLSSGFIPLPAGYSGRALTNNVTRDYIASWNLTIQKQLKGGWSVQAGYVGDRQVHVPGLWNVNYGQVGGGTASEPIFAAFGNNAAQYLETPFNHVKNDSLQAQVTHNFAKNYQMSVAYTWAKVLSDCCNALADGGPSILIPQYFQLNYSIAPWDNPEQIAVSEVATSPFGKGQRWLTSGGWASKIAEGWQLSGIFVAHSGAPFTVSSSGTSLNAPGGTTQQADLVGSGKVAIFKKYGPGQAYLDTTRFAPVTAVRFGTSGFDNVFGPGLLNLSLGVFRDFKLNERFTLQLRANAFNLTNTPTFSNPQASVNSSAFGQVSGVTAPGGTEGIDQRILQLGLHLSF
jgi:hypothetical protein